MATYHLKCPRCDCEGNILACEICCYLGFKCPGSCPCCVEHKKSSTQRKATDKQKKSTQKQVRVSNYNDQRESTQRQRRAPLRPLILRNVKKAVADNQKASSSVSQSKVDNSKVSEPSTNKVNPVISTTSSNKVNSRVGVSNEKKINTTVNETNTNKVNTIVNETNTSKVEAETQTPTHIIHYEVEPEHSSFKEYTKQEYEERIRRWNKLFWAQYDKIPYSPHITQELENSRPKTNNISRETLQEDVTELIGDHCLNCQCKNPRESCDICRQIDFQCLGTCLCCLPFRAGQRFMVFITRGLYKLPDGTFYGGGSVNLSSDALHNSEVTEDASNASKFKLNLSKVVTATAISSFLVVVFITLNRNKNLLPRILMNMRQTLLSYFRFRD